jgi:hypothetical protein
MFSAVQKKSAAHYQNKPFSANQKPSTPFFTQAKPKIGPANDSYEQEADRVADSIVNGEKNIVQSKGISTLQRKCTACEEQEAQAKFFTGVEQVQKQEEEEEAQPKLQRQPMEEEEEMLQPKGEAVHNSSYASSGFYNQLANSKGLGSPLQRSVQEEMSSGIGADFSNVRIHTGNRAAEMSQSIQAKAFTVGNHIYFNQGQYNPGNTEGKRLLAHELTHTVQQGAVQPQVQREVINMPEMTIRAGMPDTTSLTGDLEDTSGATVSYDEAAIERNSVVGSTPLPFTTNGWNAATIMENMGQYDRLSGTDSDAVRCVQAVGLMSHVALGINETVGYLNAMKIQALLRGNNQRLQTSMQVLEEVIYRIETRQANYEHLYWAMEAMHAIFNKDDRGTDSEDLHDAIVPMLDMGLTMQEMDVWCSTREEILAQGNALANGEQLMLNTWTFAFNTRFIDIPGSEDAETASFSYEGDRTNTLHRIRRYQITPGTKPPVSDFDRHRDSKSGHQLLLMKDAADGHVKLYEPELTTSGSHLIDVTADISALDRYFHDQPNFEMFEYVQILGKMTPTNFLSTP